MTTVRTSPGLVLGDSVLRFPCYNPAFFGPRTPLPLDRDSRQPLARFFLRPSLSSWFPSWSIVDSTSSRVIFFLIPVIIIIISSKDATTSSVFFVRTYRMITPTIPTAQPPAVLVRHTTMEFTSLPI